MCTSNYISYKIESALNLKRVILLRDLHDGGVVHWVCFGALGPGWIGDNWLAVKLPFILVTLKGQIVLALFGSPIKKTC